MTDGKPVACDNHGVTVYGNDMPEIDQVGTATANKVIFGQFPFNIGTCVCAILALHDSERKMIEMVTSSGKFGKVIVLLNTPAPMDLGWLDEYGMQLFDGLVCPAVQKAF